MREVWRRSYPSAPESGGTPEGQSQRSEPPTLAPVRWWWGLFLVSGAIGNIGARVAMAGDPTLEQLKFGSVASLISDLLDVPTAWLAIRIIGHITGWQNERSSRLPLPPAAPPTESLQVK